MSQINPVPQLGPVDINTVPTPQPMPQQIGVPAPTPVPSPAASPASELTDAGLPASAEGSPYGEVAVERFSEEGEVALPNISIQAFCELTETAKVIHEMSRDWRMKRTNLKIFMGGLPASIDYYHKENTPALILIESGMRGPELFAQLDQLASVCDEGTKVVMIGAVNDIKLYRQLMEKGVSDYIVPPFHPLNFVRSIGELFNDPENPFMGRSAAFFGSKGGVGSSTLSHNVAWCLSEKIHQETSLVDLDASWGTTGLDFAYDATQGLEEALAQPDRLDETLLDRIMLRHTPKLSILPASGTLKNVPTMAPDAYETIVNGIRKISAITILDMPHYWTNWTSNVLSMADDVVITAVPDLANLRNTKNLLEYLKTERPNDADPILVLNQVGRSKAHEIAVKDFATAVGMEPSLVLNFDPDSFFEAANEGKMLTEVKNANEVVSGLTYLATRLKTGEFPTDFGQKKKGLSLPFLKSKGADKKATVDSSATEKPSLFSKLKKRK